MALFASQGFLLAVAAAYVLMNTKVGLKRTTHFGILNVVILAILLGWKSTALLALLSVVAWGSVKLVIVAEIQFKARRMLFVVWSFGWFGLLFVVHKTLLEPGNDFVSLPVVGLFGAQAGSVVTGLAVPLQALAFSYVTLRLWDFTNSCLNGAPVLGPIALSGYLVPFFMTPSGPVNSYNDHTLMDEAEGERPQLSSFIDHTFTIVSGFFLKFVCAQSLSLFVRGISGPWPADSLSDTAIFLLYVFLEFSGYSLIALGVGRLLGIPTPVNFNSPWKAESFADFWTRWHISLGAFVRRNIYFPVRMTLTRALSRRAASREISHLVNFVALLIGFGFVGVWHRFSWTFLAWGLLVGLCVAVETIVRDEIVRRYGRVKSNLFLRVLQSVYSISLVILTLHVAMKEFSQ